MSGLTQAYYAYFNADLVHIHQCLSGISARCVTAKEFYKLSLIGRILHPELQYWFINKHTHYSHTVTTVFKTALNQVLHFTSIGIFPNQLYVHYRLYFKYINILLSKIKAWQHWCFNNQQ